MKNQGKSKVQDNDLQYLSLAGVRWELNDIPMTVARINTSSADSEGGAVQSQITARTQTSIVPPVAPSMPMSVDTAVAMAARPTDISALSRMIAEFNHPLRAGATNVVLSNIAVKPNGLVIVTDIPSAEDDANGKILSGAVGELLDKMLLAIGMTRENVSIIPLVFWRTPGGRTPSRSELDLARPFVNRALELLAPRVILTLGTLAASEIAGVSLPRGHGSVVSLESGAVCMPIFHPNYLMLKPAAKRDAWNALQIVQNLLKSSDE